MYFVDLVFADLFKKQMSPRIRRKKMKKRKSLHFPLSLEISSHWIGKIDVLYEIVINTVFNKELNIDAATILNIVNNLFVKVEDGKKFDIEDMVYLEERRRI